jgi:hypothetical protein
MHTLNQIVRSTGISRFLILKYASNLEIEPEIQVRKGVKWQLFSDDQVSEIISYAATQKIAKEDNPANTSQSTISSIEQELSAAKAQVQLLLDERNYLRSALDKEQANTKAMADQLAQADQRAATIVAAFARPKELSDGPSQKRGFFQRLFG